MKFVVEEIQEYKKVVSTIAGLASKKVVSTTEQCIMIEAKSNGVYLTALESGSHSYTAMVSATIHEKGAAFILASKLKSMTSKLVPKTVVLVNAIDGLLKYEVTPYGSIAESLYHDQLGFSSNLINIGDNATSDFIAESDEVLPSLLPLICNTTFNNKSILFKSSPEKFEIYSQFSETGYLKYITPTSTLQTTKCQIFLKPNLLKMVTSLGKLVDISYFSSHKSLQMSSGKGDLTIVGDNPTVNQSNTTEQILTQAVTGEAIVNHQDLMTAISWQGYNAENRQAVDLEVEGNNLVVTCNKNNEPAKIVTSKNSNFIPVTLSLNPFIMALKALGTSKSAILPIEEVWIKQRVIKLGNTEVKIVSVTPAEEPDTRAEAILYTLVHK